MSLRAMIRPSRWRSASSSSAREEDAEPLAPAVVAEVVEAGRVARGVEQRRLVERDERGGRPELPPERVQLRDPLRARLAVTRPWVRRSAASTAARRRASCSRRSLGVDDGMRGRKVVAQRRRAARPRASGIGRDRVPIERYTSMPSGWPSVSIQLGTPGSSCATTNRIRAVVVDERLRHVEARLAVREVAGVEPEAMVHRPAPVVGVGDVGRDEQRLVRAELPPARAVRDRRRAALRCRSAATRRCAGSVSRARSTYVAPELDRPLDPCRPRGRARPRARTRSVRRGRNAARVDAFDRAASRRGRAPSRTGTGARGTGARRDADSIQLPSWRSGEIHSSSEPSGADVEIGERTARENTPKRPRCMSPSTSEKNAGAHAGRRCRARGTSRPGRSRRGCRRCRGSARPTAPTAPRTGGTSGLVVSANSTSAWTAITSWRGRCRVHSARSAPEAGNGSSARRAPTSPSRSQNARQTPATSKPSSIIPTSFQAAGAPGFRPASERAPSAA